MPELNRANRQVADVDIRILKTMAAFLDFRTANTTTVGLSADAVYAMAKGARRIAFPNPTEGTMTIEAQVYPFRFFALLSDGVIHNDAVYAHKATIKATTAGELPLSVGSGSSIVTGTVFVYPKDEFGVEGSAIEGTYASNKFTAAEPSKIAVNSEYEVGFVVSRTSGVKRISFDNKNLPQDYYITMNTLDKDEDGGLTPFLMTAYKATIQRTFDLSFSSEGDPASVTLTFDLMENKEGKILDFTEIEEELEVNPE